VGLFVVSMAMGDICAASFCRLLKAIFYPSISRSGLAAFFHLLFSISVD